MRPLSHVQPVLDGSSCPGNDPMIIVENADDVRPSENGAEFERNLRRIGVLGELPVVDGGTSFTLEQITPLLLDAGHLVVNPTATRADLGGRSHKKATAREDAPFDVGEEALAKRTESLASGFGRIERGGDYLDDEAVPRSVDR